MSPPEQPARILYVEDQANLAEAVAAGLTGEGYDIHLASDGAIGWEQIQAGGFDLIILDRRLPGMDGLSILQAMRESDLHVPVILLTALGEVQDRVDGFKGGADDYLVKPFAIEELLARVSSLIRRAAPRLEEKSHRIGDLVIDIPRQQVSHKGVPVHLTAQEFSLLQLFLENRGRVLSRDLLGESLFDIDNRNDRNLLDVLIHKLRKKLDPDNDKQPIRTVRGKGYQFGE